MTSPDLKIGPGNGPVPPISTSRALTRVTPVLPRPVTEADVNPLGRSGLGVRDLLVELDEMVVRSRTPAVALEVGLEQARGAFVRNQPADALVLLDSVWDGAKLLESGWYLRGGSLTLLGLPGEAEQLVRQALEYLPNSAALRFLQSLSRLAQGDMAGARAALAATSGKGADDVLIQVYGALLLGRQGDRAGAEKAFRAIAAATPDHPAVAWGRSIMRQAARDGGSTFDDVFDVARRGPRPSASSVTPQFVRSVDATDPLESAQPPRGAPPTQFGDAVSNALRALGGRIAVMSTAESVAECRNIIVSLASGGSLAMATSPSRAFGARAVLTAIVEALQHANAYGDAGLEAESVDGWWQPAGARAGRDEAQSGPNAFRAQTGAESVGKTLQQTVRAIVSALSEGRTGDVQQLLRRSAVSMDAGPLSLLRAFSGDDVNRPTPPDVAALNGRLMDVNGTLLRTGESEIALPLRLGLALLPPNEAAHRTADWAIATASDIPFADSSVSWSNAEMIARMNADKIASVPSARMVAVILVVVGVMAFYNAHPAGAAVAIVGATIAWSFRANTRRSGGTAPNARPR